MVNGLTQVIAFAAAASAVAVATMSAVEMPKYLATSVDTVRCTVTLTRLGSPVTGSLGNSTSAGPTETSPLITWLAFEAAMALVTAGPDALLSVQLSKASAVAPASAPESAEFCAWLRD